MQIHISNGRMSQETLPLCHCEPAHDNQTIGNEPDSVRVRPIEHSRGRNKDDFGKDRKQQQGVSTTLVDDHPRRDCTWSAASKSGTSPGSHLKRRPRTRYAS